MCRNIGYMNVLHATQKKKIFIFIFLQKKNNIEFIEIFNILEKYLFILKICCLDII